MILGAGASDRRECAMADDIRELLKIALQDVYSAETQILEALPDMQDAASSATLKKAFGDHLTQTERQVQRLDEVCGMLEIEPEGETCEAMQGLVEEGEELTDDLEEGPVLDAALIGAAQKVEHYEIASYGTLISLLQSLGQGKAADILSTTLKEEKDTDALLTQIAESEVNPAAIASSSEDEDSEEEA